MRSRQLWALATICLGIFSALSIWFSASAVLAPMTEKWGITDAQGSFLTSMVNVGFCVGCLASAISSLPDFIPSPVLILIGSEGAAAANACLCLVEGFGGALACRFLVGVCLSLVYPPGVKLLSTWFDAQERGRAIGIMFGAFCLGSASPQLLSGALMSSSALDWRVIVLSTSGVAAVSGVLIYLFVEVGPFPFPSSTGRFSMSHCTLALKDSRVRLAIVAYCGHMWELFCVWAWIAKFLQSSWHLRLATAPLVAFAVISMGWPGSWCGGVLGDRFGRVRVAAASLATSGLCIATLGLLSHEGPLFIRMLLFVVWGLTGLSDSPQYSAIVTLYADQRYVGIAVTLQMLCGYLVTVLALWVVPRIATEISWRWSFFSLSAGPVVSLFALSCMRRPAESDADKQEELQMEDLIDVTPSEPRANIPVTGAGDSTDGTSRGWGDAVAAAGSVTHQLTATRLGLPRS